MAKAKQTQGGSSLPSPRGEREMRFLAFVTETAPHLAARAPEAWRQVARFDLALDSERTSALAKLRATLVQPILVAPLPPELESTPRVPAPDRVREAGEALHSALHGFLTREGIRASLQADERREVLRGMILTRLVDNQLKHFFSAGTVRWKNRSFQGKGFRSLGQEGICAAVLRLRRGEAYGGGTEPWRGDVIAPMIRDLGAVIGMHPKPETVRMVLNAQIGKSGPPMDGRDLHVGDWSRGILPATAPLGNSALTIAGIAFAFARAGDGRVAISFIGEGATSLGEWHEAINLCAARRLPAVFCVQNNQTALSTPVSDQSAARLFAEKAAGYGIPGITIDGTDPDAIAAAFTWAAERARRGEGPALIELIAMRICGHAHHDDMLYLGKEPKPSFEYPELTESGYADREAFAYWSARDPIALYAERLEREGLLDAAEVETWKSELSRLVETEAAWVAEADWPDPARVGSGVVAGEEPRSRRDPLLDSERGRPRETSPLVVENAPPFDPKGTTFLEAVMLGVGDALEADPRVFVYGQDVGGKYGNAFLLLRPLLDRFGDRIVNATLAEGGILGLCIGAALSGLRPLGEMQFNDFVATGFNQLVNNAAKLRYRWGASLPLVIRMPWGGLRSAGPYHSQNTEAWFYRTPGLKIVAPSTPHDARALLASALQDPDPVLYYEHIALYREPRIKQRLEERPPEPIPLGKAALRRDGTDLALVSYGAFVHTALRVADRLGEEGISAAVLDLRSLAPLDLEAVLKLVDRTGRLLIVHEDTRTGGIGESLAAKVQEEAFHRLDAPIRVIGALDTPVPYAPSLEEAFLPSEEFILASARRLARY
ncbi:MAG: hypothetical protein IT349_08295 [Candidatus Eisenbacteria bacterium]|nr:hypothetical protein [Candidatus Eisenbacteria bacterium]MCC7142084.1 hypothetical protein [Candidatus Eisenbacteria bacterium]